MAQSGPVPPLVDKIRGVIKCPCSISIVGLAGSRSACQCHGDVGRWPS